MKVNSIHTHRSVFVKNIMTVISVTTVTLIMLTVITGCKKAEQAPVLESSTIANVLAFKKYYTAEKNCHISIPKALISADKEAEGQVNSTVMSFFTMMSTHEKEDSFTKMTAEIKSAIERGCDINESYENNRALEMAVLYGNKAMFTFLIDNGADPLETMVNDNPKINGLNLFELAQFLTNKPNIDTKMKAMADHVLSYEEQFMVKK